MPLTEQQQRERDFMALNDYQYEEGVVTKVEPEYKDSIGITFGTGMGMGWPTVYGPVPKVGDTVRIYGGFGQQFCGGDLNGEPVWFFTKAEMNAKHEEWRVQYKREQEERYEREKDGIAKQYDALPEPLQKRIDRFRAENPKFGPESEGYEMFCCTSGANIWRAAQDPEFRERLDHYGAKIVKPEFFGVVKEYSLEDEHMTDEWEDTVENRILAWHFLSSKPMGYRTDDQHTLIPDAGIKSHSGNTYGGSVSLAMALARGKEV